MQFFKSSIIAFGRTTTPYISVNANKCLLKAPPWLGPQGKFPKWGCLLCSKWPLKNIFYIKMPPNFLLNSYVLSLLRTIYFQKIFLSLLFWLLAAKQQSYSPHSKIRTRGNLLEVHLHDIKNLGSPPWLDCRRKFCILPLLKRFKWPYLDVFNQF